MNGFLCTVVIAVGVLAGVILTLLIVWWLNRGAKL